MHVVPKQEEEEVFQIFYYTALLLQFVVFKR